MLYANQTVTVDSHLTTSSVSTTVVVNAAASMIDTQNANLSDALTGKRQTRICYIGEDKLMTLSYVRLRSIEAVVLLLVGFILIGSLRAEPVSTFCSNTGCAENKQELKRICDYIVKNKSTYPTIYIGGYYMRALVAGYEILGDRSYLNTALAYGDYLLARQMPNGFWQTGYGPVYMADTGSALGLFIALYNHADHERQQEYFDAMQRYVDSIQKDGMIHSNGAFGTGWGKVVNGTLTEPLYDPYTLSSALTGSEIFIWMYHKTRKDQYREIAYNALRWIFSTMRHDGNIPHILAEGGWDWDKRNNPQMEQKLFNTMTYGTSAYVGEGVIAFDLYCDEPSWKSWIEKIVRPNVDFLLRTQLANGTWSELEQTSWDRTRSSGIVDYLIWYYRHVYPDPRIVKAVQRFDAFVLNANDGKSYGLLYDGAKSNTRNGINAFNTVTSLTGRAVADIISPGIDAKW